MMPAEGWDVRALASTSLWFLLDVLFYRFFPLVSFLLVSAPPRGLTNNPKIQGLICFWHFNPMGF